MKRQLYDDQLIIVTGAAGLIGSNVVRHLNDQGFANLLLVDDFGHGIKWKNLYHKRFVRMISRHDLFEFLKGREEEIEAIIHLGACSDTTEIDGDYFMETNYDYSVALAEYALEHGHRFIYASSAATYGDGSLGFEDNLEMLNELAPLNIYGFSKQLFDKWVQEQGAIDRVVGLKYFNIFGPNEWHKGRMGSMVMHMTQQIQQEGKVRLFKSSEPDKYKDGDQVRDFYYVKDAARMTCAFLENDVGGIFNVGSGEPNTWNHMAKTVFKALNCPINIEYVPMPEDLVGNYQNYTCADMKRIQSELAKDQIPFENQYTFETAIEDYVSNHLLTGKRW